MKWGTRSVILCGGLVEAVREESELALAYHWGVSLSTVWRWRKVLEVAASTPGTIRLKSFVSSETMTPFLRAYLGTRRKGQPRHLTPEGEARLLTALHRPKSQQWYQSMAGHFAAWRRKPVDVHDRPWTPEDEKLLGTMPDREVASLLKRSKRAVTLRRRLKGIAYTNPALRPWSASELEMVGRLSDPEIARRTGHPLASVGKKRRELGFLVRPHTKDWTPEEEKLLGTMTDDKVARLLHRNRPDVNRRRLALGIAASGQHANYVSWTLAEERLIGTASDSAIAVKTGRSKCAVQRRRIALGLLSYREKRLRSKGKHSGSESR